MSIEEDYGDVLQNIEFAIVTVYRENRELIDYDVADALEALIRMYRSEQSGREPSPARLAEKPQQVFEATKEMCEFRLGRADLDAEEKAPDPQPISVSDLIDCLKRIEKSVRRWTKQGGRRGYLDFVSQYVV